MSQEHKDIPSPCVRNCCLNAKDICLGCGRHIDEITGWMSQNNIQKLKTLETSAHRLKALIR